MKFTFVYFFTLFSLFSQGQDFNRNQAWPYEEIKPSIKTYKGDKIKRVLFQEATGKVVLITKKANLVLSEQNAINEQLIPPRLKPKVIMLDTFCIAGKTNHIQIFKENKTDVVSSLDTYIAPTKNRDEYTFSVPIPKIISVLISDSLSGKVKKIVECKVKGNKDSTLNTGDIYFTDDKNTSIDYRVFKSQKMLKVSNAYSFGSAAVYFSGTSFDNVHTTFFENTLLDKDQFFIDELLPGSVITFDNVKVKDSKGNETTIPGTNIVLIDSSDLRINYSACVTKPAFPGGNPALVQYLKDLIKIVPEDLANRKSEFLFFNFKIHADGSVSSLPVYGGYGILEQKVIKLIENGPKWLPSTYKAEPVSSIYSFSTFIKEMIQ